MAAQFLVGNVHVGGSSSPPLFIPEIGANHDGDPQVAAEMLIELASQGAKVAKFQFYTAEELVADTARIVEWGPADARRSEPVGDMFNRMSLKLPDLAVLFKQARELGIEPFATPFSEAGADKLAEIGARCFKVAASDVTHLRFLKHLAKMGLPIILSLGKCTLGESDTAIATLLDQGCTDLAILHCVATYPAPAEEMNLRTIPALVQLYPECCVGLSDHSLGHEMCIASVALGAQLIEKHVTLSRKREGPDHWFSAETGEVGEIITLMERVHSAMGTSRKRILACETNGREKATRSLTLAQNLEAGTIIEEHHLKVVRPGNGISPAMFDQVVGMKIAQSLQINTTLTWSHFKPN
ncbi:N-acetylneuraminate synthase [Prosthecobacter fusiformis]|uniref:N-acetylneuraminate synthase n=1 Tax=Prosthecobacter fusiformis TaxID=48464 RepID=A0A4R7RZ53_9BACT|nr:N-acetylneuraminate synthase family protein [Prosthecobacter fusiformis]TDU70669.1 N-acetylneuraminate synthase [Prosthecobacter fusiformis]